MVASIDRKYHITLQIARSSTRNKPWRGAAKVGKGGEGPLIMHETAVKSFRERRPRTGFRTFNEISMRRVT